MTAAVDQAARRLLGPANVPGNRRHPFSDDLGLLGTWCLKVNLAGESAAAYGEPLKTARVARMFAPLLIENAVTVLAL